MNKFNLNRKLIFYLIAIVVLIVMAIFNIFYQLGNFPIYSWDEARHGVSAFEMLQNHNYIVNTYRFKNDYWNLKPPLSFWAIILGYKLAGFNALGLRLCSAIFAVFTILFVTGFVYKRFGKIASVITMLVLSTSTQFLTNHSSRTGDADSLFVFLFTIAILSLLLFHENKKWLIYVTGIAFSLAFLTKSWHSGNIVVITAIYLFATGKYKLLSLKQWLIFFLCAVLPVTIWALFRYHYDGLTFFKEMVAYDLLHRSSTSIEGHVGGIFYYISILLRFYRYWLYLFILLGLLIVRKDMTSSKKIAEFMKGNTLFGILIWILVPFILFTIAKTKIRWYILPMYPPLSIIIGVLASHLLQRGNVFFRVILTGVCLLVAVTYETQIIHYLNHPLVYPRQNLIKMAANNKQMKDDSLYLYHNGKHVDWLQSEVLTAELADGLRVKNGSFHEFLTQNKDVLLIPQKSYSKELMKTYHLMIIDSNQWGYLVDKSS